MELQKKTFPSRHTVSCRYEIESILVTPPHSFRGIKSSLTVRLQALPDL